VKENPVLKEITSRVVHAAQLSLGDKLDNVILYGSYARGNNKESDVDFMMLADIPCADRGYERDKICEILGNIELDLDVVLSIIKVADCEIQ